MEQNDIIARCLTAGDGARVVVALTTGVAREAARRHEASGIAAVALARASTAGLLLATLTKGNERVTLQVLGSGTLRGIAVDAGSDGNVRAFVSHPRSLVPSPGAAGRTSVADAVGRDGVVVVVRDLGLREQVRGQVALVSGEIDEDVEAYLTTSEQIPSALACEAVLGPDLQVLGAAGLLVQMLPGSNALALLELARLRMREGALHDAVRQMTEAGGDSSPAALAAAVLGDPPGEGFRVLDVRSVQFHCPCSRERAARTLGLLGENELQGLILDEGGAEVKCEFCRERYRFTSEELERVRQQVRRESSPPS